MLGGVYGIELQRWLGLVVLSGWSHLGIVIIANLLRGPCTLAFVWFVYAILGPLDTFGFGQALDCCKYHRKTWCTRLLLKGPRAQLLLLQSYCPNYCDNFYSHPLYRESIIASPVLEYQMWPNGRQDESNWPCHSLQCVQSIYAGKDERFVVFLLKGQDFSIS